jgi:hypothetical protein
VHGADAGADQHAAASRPQPPRRSRAIKFSATNEAPMLGSPTGWWRRVVVDVGAQVEGEHADEVHGPDAGAERQAAGAEHDPALGAVGRRPGRRSASAIQEAKIATSTDNTHQLRRVHPVAEQRRVGWQRE